MTMCNRGRHLWARTAAQLAGAALLACAALPAQTFLLNPLTTAGVSQNGFRIYNVSAFTSYSTVDGRWNQFLQSLAGGQNLNLPTHSTFTGVTGAVGYHAGTENGDRNFSVIYSPSYSYSTYGQSYGSMTHVLALNWTMKLVPQWQFSVSASGVTGNFEQLLFSPTSAQNLASLAASAQGLASVSMTGQTNDPAASAAAGAAAAITPQQRLFYGDRMVSAVTQVALSYAHSSRFSLGFSAGGTRMQHLVDHSGTPGQNYYLIPQTTDVAFATSLSYLLTPRTSVNGSVSYGRSISALNDTQYASSQVGMGRKLTEHWHAQFAGGAGYILPVTNVLSGVHGKQWQASGGIGYRGGGHVVVLSAARSVSDFYGLGAAATLNSSLGWGWRRQGASWSIQAGAGIDKLLGSQIAALGLGNNGFRADAGVYWSPYHRGSVGLQYAFASYSGIFPVAGILGPGQALHYTQHSVRLNIGWGMGGGGVV